MHLDTLPNEIATHVFLSLPSIESVIALSSTCHHFRDLYHRQRLAILTQAADADYGPINDAIQLVTHNASQPAHIRRDVPMSGALLHQVIRVGKVARQWEELYPFKKWKADFVNRRLLTTDERYVLRRAIYRLWLFTKAFHNRLHIRTARNNPQIMHERAALLHNFPTAELAEMLDVHLIIRDMIANNICPSNGKIRQKFSKRYPESHHQLLFNSTTTSIHLNYPPPPPSGNPFAPDGWMQSSIITASKYNTFTPAYNRLHPSRFHEPGAEGWGDEVSHYYAVEDMMKMDPEQVLFLKERCPLKVQVEAYVRTFEGGGEWFVDNGETFSETLGFVVRQRGGEMEGLNREVEDGEMGVAVVV